MTISVLKNIYFVEKLLSFARLQGLYSRSLYQNPFYMFIKLPQNNTKFIKKRTFSCPKRPLLVCFRPIDLSILGFKYFYKFASLELWSNVWVGGQGHVLPLGAMSSWQGFKPLMWLFNLFYIDCSISCGFDFLLKY
jgi:hypothetical protein